MEVDIAGSLATAAMQLSTGENQEKQEDSSAKETEAITVAADTGSSATLADTSAGSTAEAPKVSMMAKLGANFIIPKNKALVPVTRTTTKWEPLDPKREELKPLSRKTRWGPDLTEEPVVKRGRALALQTRAEQLAAQLESNNLEIDNNEATRSPSPPPLYDAMGHRMNTREGRKRDQLDVERREAVGECMKLNPFYKPPAGFRPVPKEAKLFIPVKENPGYNFIGLILGPRGITQKRLEANTGCKITIRGKGSIKDGKTLPYRYGKDNDGIGEELHVHIAAETYEKVDAAVAIIEPLLIPVDEDRNIYKMKQLRELAEMNGTVRDFVRICTLCGEEGHREWQCPKDKLQTFQAKVICRLCGDGSHPTFDCPLKHSGQGKAIDKEYLSFLEELGAGLGGIDAAVKPDVDSQLHSSGSDMSQPMLLTASGAQPMPSRWMDSGSNTGSDGIGGFPRLPFPFPFPPPGPQGINAMNLLPRFFNPAFFSMFRGRPMPPPSIMMAFMLSAFRGRFPFPPPFGMGPNMMRPPMASPSASEGTFLSTTPMENPTSELAGRAANSFGTSQNNFEPMQCNIETAQNLSDAAQNHSDAAQNHSEFLPPPIGAFVSHSLQHPSLEVPVTCSAEPASTPPSALPLLFSAATPPPAPKSPPLFEVATAFPSTGNLAPTSVLPPELPPPLGHPGSPVTPPLPGVPSFQPFPPVRPVVQPIAPASFSHLGGPGLASSVAPPSWAGTSNISSLPNLENLSKPGLGVWSQSQFSVEPSSALPQLNNPASEYPFFPKPSTINLVPTRNDTPYSLSSNEDAAVGSGLHSLPPMHPMNAPSQLGGYFTPGAIPSVTPRLPPDAMSAFSSTAGGHFGGAAYSQPTSDHSFGYPEAPLGPPAGIGSLSQTSHDYHRGSIYSSSLEFPYARPLESSSYAGSHLRPEFSKDVYSVGYMESKESRGTTMMPPTSKEAFERPYRYDPSIPLHLLQQRGGSMHEPQHTSLMLSGRPGGPPQGWGGGQFDEGGLGHWQSHNSQNFGLTLPKADSDYDKFKSSAGFL